MTLNVLFPSIFSSQFILNISTSYSEIIPSQKESEYKKLINCPMHNTSSLLSLADIIYNCQNADGLNLNMLVAIKDVSIKKIHDCK